MPILRFEPALIAMRAIVTALAVGGGLMAGSGASAAMLVAPPAVLADPAMPGRPVAFEPDTYRPEETVAAGQAFFGHVSGSLATVIERSFAQYGEPVGYILGEEASGAFFGGLRYGEGVLYTRAFGNHAVYWQGPSFGMDFGADGARVMVLVYQLPTLATLFQRYTGVNGSAYLLGGFGMTVLAADTTYLVPVRSGIGARLGVNLGYLKFTPTPTWNPF